MIAANPNASAHRFQRGNRRPSTRTSARISEIPAVSSPQFTKWLMSSHQSTVSYRFSVFPRTSLKKGRVTRMSMTTGYGRDRKRQYQIAGTTSITSP